MLYFMAETLKPSPEGLIDIIAGVSYKPFENIVFNSSAQPDSVVAQKCVSFQGLSGIAEVVKLEPDPTDNRYAVALSFTLKGKDDLIRLLKHDVLLKTFKLEYLPSVSDPSIYDKGLEQALEDGKEATIIYLHPEILEAGLMEDEVRQTTITLAPKT